MKFKGRLKEGRSKRKKLKPKDSDAFFNRAKVKKVGDIKGACEDWKKAANLGDEEAEKSL